MKQLLNHSQGYAIFLLGAIALSLFSCTPTLFKTKFANSEVNIATTALLNSPVTSPGSLNVAYASSGTGSLVSTNPIGTPLSYSIVSPPSKGNVVLSTSTGTYTYTASSGKGGTDTFTFKAVDSESNSSNISAISVTIANSLCGPSRQILSYTGGDQSWALPSNCSTNPNVYIKMWGGGGGGGGHYNRGSYEFGGAGGYAGAGLRVDITQNYVIVVGGGGPAEAYNQPYQGVSTGLVYGGGGSGFFGWPYFAGAGGGRSAVILNGTEILTAGGGGGGGSNGSTGYGYENWGGPGGGTVGVNGQGTAGTSPGTGGTQTTGGVNGYWGSAFTGGGTPGNSGIGGWTDYVAGGGGGYFGGATGSNYQYAVPGAGGGSSYMGGPGVTNGVTVAGYYYIAGNNTDPDNLSAGSGGYAFGLAGSPGSVIIYSGAAQIAGISPSYGTAAGGTILTLTGVGFVADTTVLVGGSSCSFVTINSGNQLTCTTPAGTNGAQVDVVVKAPGADAATLIGGFTYSP